MSLATDGFTRICEWTLPTISGAHTDFPGYINGEWLPSAVLALLDDGGGDLRFSSDEAGDTQLPCEVVTLDTVAESGQVHVKIPNATTGEVVHIWGNKTGESQPAVTDTYGRNAVWAGLNFISHFQSTSGNAVDSTGGSTVGATVPTGVTRGQSGQLGDAFEWDGDTAVLPERLGYWDDSFTEASIACWINVTSTGSSAQYFIEEGTSSVNGQALFYRIGTSKFSYLVGISGTTVEIVSDAIPPGSGWVHVRGVYNNGAMTLLVNGVAVATGSNGTSVPDHSGGAAPEIGNSQVRGLIDEPSRSSIVRSDDWYLTEYQNQSSVGAWGTFTAVSSGNNYVINGDSSVTVVPSADFEIQRNYTISGDVPLELTPVADFLLNRSYSIEGDVPVSLVPDSDTQYSQGNEILGDVPITLSPNATLEFNKQYSLQGDIQYNVVPASDLQVNRNYTLDGSSSIEIISNSGFELNREYTLSGDVSLNITPNSGMVYASGDSIVGDVTYSIIPNSLFEITRSYSIDGLTNIEFTVQSDTQKNINVVIDGNVLIEVTPSANFQFGIENIIDGDVNFNVTPESSFVFNRQYVLNGNIGINLSPDSETEITKNYTFNGQSEVSFSVEGDFEFDGQKLINGDVQINVVPNSEMVLDRVQVIKDPLFTLSVEDEVIILSVESSVEVRYAVAR